MTLRVKHTNNHLPSYSQSMTIILATIADSFHSLKCFGRMIYIPQTSTCQIIAKLLDHSCIKWLTIFCKCNRYTQPWSPLVVFFRFYFWYIFRNKWKLDKIIQTCYLINCCSLLIMSSFSRFTVCFSGNYIYIYIYTHACALLTNFLLLFNIIVSVFERKYTRK